MTDTLHGADLHLHTVYSDGIYTPEGLVRAALDRSLRAIAVTDHDSIAGVAPAREAAAGTGLEVVCGIELAVPLCDTEIHLIGLFVDNDVGALQERLVEIRARRRSRITETIRRLGRLGIAIDAEEVFRAAAPGLPGRVHVAQVLAARGRVPNYQAAFQKYIGNGKPAYVERRWPDLPRVMDIIHRAGGLAVYAHPRLTDRDHAVPEMVRAGLDAIEVWHPYHSEQDVTKYLDICGAYDLLPTAGSDCHGTGQGLIGTARMSSDAYETLSKGVSKRSAVAVHRQEKRA